jgi:hypothetical protein
LKNKQDGILDQDKTINSIQKHNIYTNVIEINSHTNIISVSVPHQYDLSDWSCVNSEVNTFNRKLVKLVKPLNHVILVKVHLKRKFFAEQSLHMNNVGKEKIALKIADVVTSLFKIKATNQSVFIGKLNMMMR